MLGARAALALVASAAWLGGAATAGAQASGSFNRHGSGARAAGMGNAFVAVSDDGTAAAWNPAGLSQLRRPELSLVFSSIRKDVLLEGARTLDDRFTFTPASDVSGAQFIDFASLAIPFELGRPVTFQVGWRRLYSLSTNESLTLLREPTPLAPGEPVTEISDALLGEGSVDILSLAVATRASRRLSLGVSVDLWRGAWAFTRTTRQQESGGSSQFLQSAEDSGIGGSANLNLGMMLHFPAVRVGVVYHTPVASSFRNTSTLDTTLPAPGLSVSQSFSPDAESRFPGSLGVGVSWKPEPHWTLAADATYDRWKDWTISGAPGRDGPVSFADAAPPDRTSTRNTVSLNAGAEWVLRKPGYLIPLRFGLGYEPQGQRDPILYTGYALKVLSFGVGYNTNRLKLDVAVQHGWFDIRRTASLSIESQVGALGGYLQVPDAVGLRTERFWRVKLSAIVRIEDTGALKRALGELFGGP